MTHAEVCALTECSEADEVINSADLSLPVQFFSDRFLADEAKRRIEESGRSRNVAVQEQAEGSYSGWWRVVQVDVLKCHLHTNTERLVNAAGDVADRGGLYVSTFNLLMRQALDDEPPLPDNTPA